ncbi:hypothetical protein SprV_0100056700 [Sparganum proliferum]
MSTVRSTGGRRRHGDLRNIYRTLFASPPGPLTGHSQEGRRREKTQVADTAGPARWRFTPHSLVHNKHLTSIFTNDSTTTGQNDEDGWAANYYYYYYAIDWILGRALRESDGVEFALGHRLTDLDYADDIALLASSFCDLQSMVSRVNEVAKLVGLSINAGKTKVFSSCIPDQEKAPLGIDGCQLEEVDSFNCLGARLLPPVS